MPIIRIVLPVFIVATKDSASQAETWILDTSGMFQRRFIIGPPS